MKRLNRPGLPDNVQSNLASRQADVDRQRQDGSLDVQRNWKAARQTATLDAVHDALKSMTGKRERCMYCLDSHGTDIEHFWPKTPYPERMFRWPNLLLCCAECGRFKGERFPLSAGAPLLVDPTAEDPWQHLDFDPATGNIVARFDPTSNQWDQKGTETVTALQLDRREAMSNGYQRTFRRLVVAVQKALETQSPDGGQLVRTLLDLDDHGLMGWCFTGTGQNEAPFRELRKRHPRIWTSCVDACSS